MSVANDSEIRKIYSSIYSSNVYTATQSAEDLSNTKGCDKETVKDDDKKQIIDDIHLIRKHWKI